ncbi:ribonuclease H-like domain-containing protein, partial [Panaeolus papilionaceus]
LGDQDNHTVYEAELIGLTLTLEMVVEEDLKGLVRIGLDNQAVMKTLHDREARFAQGHWKAIQVLIIKFLKRNRSNRIEIRWVPGHEGIAENERADEMARE